MPFHEQRRRRQRQLNVQGPDAPSTRGNVEIGGLRTFEGQNRLIGNVGFLTCDQALCFGSTRLLHSDGNMSS